MAPLNLEKFFLLVEKECGTKVRILRRIEPDNGDTTRNEHSEQTKSASRALGRAKYGSLREHSFFALSKLIS